MSLAGAFALVGLALLVLALLPAGGSAAARPARRATRRRATVPTANGATTLAGPTRSAVMGACVASALVVVLGATVLLAPAALTGGAVGWLGRRRRDAARGRARVEALGHDLPDALELLAAAVDGGAPLERSLAAVAVHVPDPLGGALLRAARAAAVPTGPSLSRALALEGPALRSLTALVGAAEDLGTPVAASLRTLASDERERRRRAVRERAARAAPKLSLVVGFLLAPAALLLVLAGQILAVLESFTTVGP